MWLFSILSVLSQICCSGSNSEGGKKCFNERLGAVCVHGLCREKEVMLLSVYMPHYHVE